MSGPVKWLFHDPAMNIGSHNILTEVQKLRTELDDVKRELRELKEKEKGQWLLGPPRFGY